VIRLISGFANRVLVGSVDRNDVDLDHNFTSVLDFSLNFISQVKPEFILIFTIKCQFRVLILSLQGRLVIVLVEAKWFLDECTIFDELFQVEACGSDHFILGQEVSVPGLQIELVSFSWVADSEHESVLEIGLSILTSKVGVSFLHVFLVVKVPSEVSITGAFPVHLWHIHGIQDANSHLESLHGFRRNLVNLNRFGVHSHRIYLDPALNGALVPCARLVIKLSELDRLVLHHLPAHGEVSVLEINVGCSD